MKILLLKKPLILFPFLHSLGIEGVYCSPLFESASPNGYDITNPNALNAHIGTKDDYEAFCNQLKHYEMKQVLDIVPNHMGIKGSQNLFWLDVMEKGPGSPYAGFFDINWTPEKPSLNGKVLLPILETYYGHILEKKAIQLFWDKGFWIRYQDYQLPIALQSYFFILKYIHQGTPSKCPNEWSRCLGIAKQLEDSKNEERTAQKNLFINLYNTSKFIQSQIDQVIVYLNENKLLHPLLEKQFYRLCRFLSAGQEINYRRFFNINDLVAIHMEKEAVFNTYHEWVFQLLKEKKIQGLRIDHPDGLYNPSAYFKRLKKANPPFMIVEKILDFKETISEKWEVEGTVGYEFINILNGSFIKKENEEAFTQIYEDFIEEKANFSSILYQRKKRYINLQMRGEVNFLGTLLEELASENLYYRDFTKIDLSYAIEEIMACFPVYRTYIHPEEEIEKKERNYVLFAVNAAKEKSPEIDPFIFDFIQSILLCEFDYSKEEKHLGIDFLLRFEQLTAPIMAKGLEDSTFYIYNRMISLNEVGGRPDLFGHTKTEFHHFNKEKLAKWPLGLLPSSTHDTKFSEDVHFRLNVLTEIPHLFEEKVNAWKTHNKKYKKRIKNSLFPDLNTEYFIYQLLLGIPFFLDKDRVWQSVLKAIREAGIYTSWHLPHAAYENSVRDFLFDLITEGKENLFYPSFVQFQEKIALYGYWNSLSALVLKIGSCGIVDIYQGCETWNFSLVDPDNRKKIDYATEKTALQNKHQIEALF